MKRFRLTLIPLILSVSSVHSVGQTAEPLAITPTPRTENPGWMKIVERQAAKAKAGPWDVVLIGDSITAGWQSGAPAEIWAKHFPAYRTLNLGIAADKTENVLWRLGFPGTLTGYQPKLFIVMIGTNNTGHQNRPAQEHNGAVYQSPPADTAAGVKAILDALRAKLPETKILLLAIFPRGATPTDKMRQQNEATNALIAKLANGQDIVFKDIGKTFLTPEGELTKEIMPDLLHLSEKGYDLWAQAIKADVKALMGK